ncbi:MAG: TlpA family protein disulfide reductase [Phocaeicola sp.]
MTVSCLRKSKTDKSSKIETTYIEFLAQDSAKIYFQPESDQSIGYNQVTPNTTIEIPLCEPTYYYYVTNNSFHTVYITPGAKIKILDNKGKVSFEGDNVEINNFIAQNSSVRHISSAVEMYSKEWHNEMRSGMEELIKRLEQTSLPAEFKAIHSIYIRFTYLYQLLTSPEAIEMIEGKMPNLHPGYYDEFKKISFDDPKVLYYPKWFTVMKTMFLKLEKEGDIVPNHLRCLSYYCERIPNQEVKNAFIIRFLESLITKNYCEDYSVFLAFARSAINSDASDTLRYIDSLESRNNELRKKSENIVRGSKMPLFLGVDVNGKTHSSDKYKGKVWILDFWFSACLPCKVELTYMETLARELKGENIQFFSLSLDRGDQLVNSWKELVRDRKGDVLQFNIPDGFKSELAKYFDITSVPRIIIINSDGKVVEAYANRPSDPKLKEQILRLLNPETITYDNASQAVRDLRQLETAAEKEKLYLSFVEKINQQDALFAKPMAQAMLAMCIESFFKEDDTEKASEYLAFLADGGFKRDIVFTGGARAFESGNLPVAEKFISIAAEMTLRLREKEEVNEMEISKYPLIFGIYSRILVDKGEIKKAIPFIELAYENEVYPGYDITDCYLEKLMYEKDYDKAYPILEEFIKIGTAAQKHINWFKTVYKSKNRGDKGFEQLLESLKKESLEKLKAELARSMVKVEAPLFTLVNLENKEVSLSSLRGKIVIIDFWATWCGPCKTMFSAMKKASQLYADRDDVEFLFINTLETRKDLVEAVAQYVKENDYNFNILFDKQDLNTKKYPVIESYKVKGIPAKFVIDKEGYMRFALVGFSGSEEEVVQKIRAMINLLL